MTKNEVIDSLTFYSPHFPKEAIKEVQTNREDYIPELLESLDYAYKNAKELREKNDDNSYFLHVYAMFLSACIKFAQIQHRIETDRAYVLRAFEKSRGFRQ